MGLQMRPIDFKLTGNEFQEVFNIDKYVALAYMQPKGVLLQEQVEQHWKSWCEVVAEAPWLRYWKRSSYARESCVTPNDQLCLVSGCGSVPLIIFTTAVWGFGIDGWLESPGMAFRPLSKACKVQVNTPLLEILKLQGMRMPNASRTYMWDDKLYRGCGISLPLEFGELDRWLQPLWEKVCSM